MKNLIQAYLEDHKSAWAETTLKSETARLGKLAPHLDKSPQELYEALKLAGKKKYTIKTVFIRLCDLEKWAIRRGHRVKPEFQNFMELHANRFKHSYMKEDLTISYEEAKRRLETLSEPHRSMGLSILKTGVRISEAYTAIDGKVIGKGGKPRKIFGTIEMTAPKFSFYRKLKAVGLKPHTLRKLCATKLAENGATAADLCKVFGWASINTAYLYLQGKDDEKLQTLMEACAEG